MSSADSPGGNAPSQSGGGNPPASSRETVPRVQHQPASTAARATIQPGQAAQSGQSLPPQFGRYRLEECLGQGAMGTVYRAHDTQLDRTVALKIPKFDASAQPLLERFYREARSAATLSHPGICPVFDVGEIDGTHYISMGFIDGKPLSTVLRSSKSLSEKQAAQIVRKLAIALQEAHLQGVVHRDLKPDNVMIGPKSTPIIMDFGLARRTSGTDDARVTQGGQMLGTPAYMSPEQVEGNTDLMGPRSDIYSLGVILYELLTGQLPYDGSVASVLAQIVKAEPRLPAQLRPDLNPQLQAICLKMMAAQPDGRYRSMADVARDLGLWLKNEPATVMGAGDPSQLAAIVNAAQSTVSRRRMSDLSLTIKGGVAAAAVFALIAGFLLLGETAEQIVRITIDDPAADVFVDGAQIRLDDLGATVELSPGNHEFQVRRGDVVVRTDTFAVIDGDNPVLELQVLQLGPASEPISMLPVASPVAEEPDTTRAAAEWALASGFILGISDSANGDDSSTSPDIPLRQIKQVDQLPDHKFAVRVLIIPANARVDDDNWSRLSEFHALTELISVHADLNDAALKSLSTARELQRVTLSNARISPEGLRALKTLSSLSTLELSGTPQEPLDVPATAAAVLAELSELRTLSFTNTTLSDDGFQKLTPLTLSSLSLTDSTVTSEAVEAYRAAHPDCLISIAASAAPMVAARPVSDTVIATPSETGNSPTKPTAPDRPRELPARFTDSDDSRLVTVGWALSHYFKLDLSVDGASIEASDFDDVPHSEFTVTGLRITSRVPVDESDWGHLSSLLPTVSHLSVSNESFGDAQLKTITTAAQLQSLTLAGCSLTDDALQSVAKLESLRQLTLSRCQLTDAGVKHLSELKLKQLDLTGNQLSDASALALTEIRTLESLVLKHTEVGDYTVEQLASLPRLLHVDLSSTQVTDAGLQKTKAFRRLRSLTLDSTAVTDAGLQLLAAAKLRTLSLTSTHCTLAAVDEFRKSNANCEVTYSQADGEPPAPTSIVSLTGTGKPKTDFNFSVDDTIPEAFRNSRNPEVRAVGWMIAHNIMPVLQFQQSVNGFSSRSVRSFDEVPNVPFRVTQVTVTTSSFIQKKDWEFLRLLPNLTSFHVMIPEFDDESLAYLAGHDSIQTVNLSGTNVSEDGLRHLLTLPRLTKVSISGLSGTSTLPAITDDAISTLTRIRGLTGLTLQNAQITNRGLKRLATARPTLTKLVLDDTPVTDEGVLSLTPMRNLSHLSLQATKITDAALTVTRAMPRLSLLNIARTAITDSGLATCSGHPGITSLMLQSTQITDGGLQQLAGFPQLSSLYLNDTDITDRGLTLIARLPRITYLGLEGTKVSHNAAQALQNARPKLYISMRGVVRPN